MPRLKDYCKLPDKVPKLTFDIIGGGDVMPVGAFWGPFTQDPRFYTFEENNGKRYPFPDFLTDEYMKLIKKAGLNMILANPIYWGRESDDVRKCLDLCAKHNFASFVLCTDMWQEIELKESYSITKEKLSGIVEPFIHHPACAGVFLKDEPFANEFPVFKTITDIFYDECGYNDKVLAIDWAGHAEQNRKYFYNFQMEIMDYVLNGRPKVLIVDCYVFDKNVTMEKYFKQLSVAYNTARVANIPMWYYMQAGTNWGEGLPKREKGEYRPYKGEFMWNYNILLAYGVKGLLFFPTLQPYGFCRTEEGEDYQCCGLVGCNGETTQWFDFAVEANKQLKAIEKVLMNSCQCGVLAFGEEALSLVANNPEYIHYKSYKELFNVQGETLIGCFDYQGKTAVYVVNFSREKPNAVKLTFEKGHTLSITQKGETRKLSCESIDLLLDAGEGVLIVVETSDPERLWTLE